jgi:hypothetical protein
MLSERDEITEAIALGTKDTIGMVVWFEIMPIVV